MRCWLVMSPPSRSDNVDIACSVPSQGSIDRDLTVGCPGINIPVVAPQISRPDVGLELDLIQGCDARFDDNVSDTDVIDDVPFHVDASTDVSVTVSHVSSSSAPPAVPPNPNIVFSRLLFPLSVPSTPASVSLYASASSFPPPAFSTAPFLILSLPPFPLPISSALLPPSPSSLTPPPPHPLPDPFALSFLPASYFSAPLTASSSSSVPSARLGGLLVNLYADTLFVCVLRCAFLIAMLRC